MPTAHAPDADPHAHLDGPHLPTALIWQDEELRYDFGPDHPLQPIRVELTVDLIRACRLDRGPGVLTLPRDPYDVDDLLRLHAEPYVEAVMRLSAHPDPRGDMRFGLGPGDTPVFGGMHEASMEVCGASVAAARAVWEGTVAHAFNPAGGLHHAMPDRAAGFCVYDDPAACIRWLLDHGADRVAYVDVDTHHGDGVQTFFYDDPRVLTISLHESGRTLFPGTGFADEIGSGDARGSSLNVALPMATTGEVYLEALEAVVPDALDAFEPDVLVTQLGCDTHMTDPLAHLALTTDDYHDLAVRLHDLAHTAAGGRWVALGGGGYQIATVVPRAWTIYFAELTGQDVPFELPYDFLRRVEEATGQQSPREFLEGRARLSPDRLELTRRATRDAVEALKREAFDHLERLR
jgi:acetoin utilization protein AcuC